MLNPTTNPDVEKMFALSPGLKNYVYRIENVLCKQMGRYVLSSQIRTVQSPDNRKLIMLTLTVNSPSVHDKLVEFFQWVVQASTEPCRTLLALTIDTRHETNTL